MRYCRVGDVESGQAVETARRKRVGEHRQSAVRCWVRRRRRARLLDRPQRIGSARRLDDAAPVGAVLLADRDVREDPQSSPGCSQAVWPALWGRPIEPQTVFVEGVSVAVSEIWRVATAGMRFAGDRSALVRVLDGCPELD